MNCLPSTTVCLSQLLFACLNYCLPSTTVYPQLSALNCLPSTNNIAVQGYLKVSFTVFDLRSGPSGEAGSDMVLANLTALNATLFASELVR